jgi:hypothetical protein
MDGRTQHAVLLSAAPEAIDLAGHGVQVASPTRRVATA